MIMDAVKVMLDFDKKTFSVLFPYCFDDLKGADANFEMVSSNTMQPVRLIYSYNIASTKIAHIFVHTNLKNMSYQGAEERAQMHQKLFYTTLKFDYVEVHTDLSKN